MLDERVSQSGSFFNSAAFGVWQDFPSFSTAYWIYPLCIFPRLLIVMALVTSLQQLIKNKPLSVPQSSLSLYQLSHPSFNSTAGNLATPFRNALQVLPPGFQKSTHSDPHLPSCPCPLLPDACPMLWPKGTICSSQNVSRAFLLPPGSPTATTLIALLTEISLVLQETRKWHFGIPTSLIWPCISFPILYYDIGEHLIFKTRL